MIRTTCAVLLLFALPSCVAAIGNTGYGLGAYPKTASPLLEERVESARRIVELRQRHLDVMQTQQSAQAVSAADVADAEIAVEVARLRLLQCRIDLATLRSRVDGDD